MVSNSRAVRSGDQFILEGILATRNADGTLNVSPMGPVTDRDLRSFRLRPFQGSRTFTNLAENRHAVFHVTDDVGLVADAIAGRTLKPEVLQTTTADSEFNGLVLADACRWYGLQVEQLDTAKDRAEIDCRVIQSGRMRDFMGWNRASHAVLEAAILATRVHLLDVEELRRQLEALRLIVYKTASDRERRAMQVIEDHVCSVWQRDVS